MKIRSHPSLLQINRRVLGLILGLALNSTAHWADAATINVPGNQPTIQAAVTAANPGDTIVVADGTYLEKVTINKSVTIESVNGRGSTIIDGSAIGVVTGTIRLAGPLNGVTIGGLGKGFTIIGSDSPSPGIEWAAIYGTGSLSNISIIDNEVRANGDSALTFEFGVSGSNILIDRNEFSGKTFAGAQPNGTGFGSPPPNGTEPFWVALTQPPSATWNQFNLPNVPRQLVVMGSGGGAGASTLTGVTFTNNVISGTAGGINVLSEEQGNTLVTIDTSSSVVTNNLFQGETNRFGTALRMRRPNTNIANNVFDDTNMGPSTAPFFVQNNTPQTIPDIIAANGIDQGAFVVGGGAWVTIQAAITAAPVGATIEVLAGTYIEDVLFNKAVTLQGAPGSIIKGPIGGAISTVTFTASASGAVIEGFVITRDGNDPANYNNSNLNSAGVKIQGLTITNITIRGNTITGNRSAIDINASGGHHILQNTITENHTGIIFRNQTDNMVVEENAIVNNRTVGILFLNANTFPNPEVEQTALNGSFTNNNISGNWYGQIVDRQIGGIVPPPGTNLKNFSGNWFGSTTPVISTANSAELGYGSPPLPIVFGGMTDPIPVGQPDICGPASANFDITPLLTSGADTDPVTPGFQGDFTSLKLITDIAQVGAPTFNRIQEAIDLDSNGGVIAVPAGTYAGDVDASAKAVTLVAGASPGQVVVNGNFTLTADDTLDVEVETNVPGTGYDQWVVNGDISLGGATLVLSGPYLIAGGDSLIILDNGGGNPISGAFAGITSPSDLILNFLGSGLNATAEYTGGAGDDFEITFPAVLVVEQPAGSPLANASVLDFGDILLDGFADRSFVIRNDGASDITGISFSAPGGDFEILPNSVPSVLTPGQSAIWTIRYAPTSIGGASQGFTINSSEDPYSVTLTGTGVELPVASNGNAFSDGNIASIVVGGTRTITVTVFDADTYRLTLSGGSPTPSWGTVSGPGLSLFSSTILEIDKTLINQVLIADADVATLTVNMTGSATEDFEDDFSVLLDSGTGVINVTNGGRCVFLGGTSFSATNMGNAASAIQVGSSLATLLSVEDAGEIFLNAEGSNLIIQDNAVVSAESGSITLQSGTTIFLDNVASVTAVDGSVSLLAGTTLTTDPSTIISTSGTGDVTLTARNVLMNNDSSVTTVDGDILISANSGAVAGDFEAIEILGLIQSTGTGDIRLEAISGSTTADEAILITGSLGNRGKVLANSGNIVLDGVTQALSTVSGAAISLSGTTVEISSVSGDVSLFGTAEGTNTGGADYGISIAGGAKVTTAGTGAITLDGNAGSGGDTNYGVLLTGTGSTIQSVDGTINITGNGGAVGIAGDNNYRGVSIDAGGVIQSTGSGPINITGTGGVSPQGSGHAGVVIGSGSATVQGVVTSFDGDITIIGEGKLGGGASTTHYGVYIFRGAVSSTGAGSISINATVAGNAIDAFMVSSNGNSQVLSSGTGDVVITADRMNLGTSLSNFNIGTNTLTLTPATAARPVNLGAADSAGQLGLSSLELSRVTTTGAGRLIIDSNGGDMTLSAALSPATTTNLELDASGANLIPLPGVVGTDVSVANLIITSGTTFGSAAGVVNITSNTANTGYPQLVATGTVDITGVILPTPTSSNSFDPALSSVTTLIVSGGTLTGTFTAKPEGFEFLDFLNALPPKKAVLSYAGGNATLTVQGQPEINVHDGATDLTPQLVDGQPTAVDFGSTDIGVPVLRSFTLKNVGSAPLTISSVTVGTAGYTVSGLPTGPIDPEETHTFTVSLDGDSAGTFNDTLTIVSDDANGQATFDFPLTGVVNNVNFVATGIAGSATLTAAVSGGQKVTVHITTVSLVDYYALTLPAENDWNGTIPGGSGILRVSSNGTPATHERLLIPKTYLGTGLLKIIDGAGFNEVDMAGSPSLNFDSSVEVILNEPTAGNVAFNQFGSSCNFTGSASLSVSTVRSISIPAGVVSVFNGGLTLLANQQLIPTSGITMTGVSIPASGIVRSTGSGNIVIKGRSGDTSGGFQNGVHLQNDGKIQSLGTGSILVEGTGGPGAVAIPGISFDGSGTEITTAGGNVTLTGVSNSTTGPGVGIKLNGKVKATGGTPVITLNGTGANNAASFTYGVEMSGTHGEISSAGGGSISIVGTARGEGNNKRGVLLSGKVLGTSLATPVAISITGYGSDVASLLTASGNHGVHISGSTAEVTAYKGSISVFGYAGDLPELGTGNQDGVLISGDSLVASLGDASVAITGVAGTGGTGSLKGVRVLGSTVLKSRLTTVNGSLVITGTGGGTTSNAHGVELDGQYAEVSTSGTGNITINGTRGPAATGGSGFEATAAVVVKSTGSGAVTIAADRINLSATSVFNLGTSGITFKPLTAGHPVTLGVADSGSVLGLTNAELARVTVAGRITVGATNSGKVTVTGAISVVAPGAELELASGGDIEIPELASLTSLGNVKFNTTAGKVLPIRTGTEVTAGGNVTFATGTTLQLPLEAPTPGDSETSYRVLNVAGGVNLTGAVLDFDGDFIPTAPNLGDKLTIVQNDGADAVDGSFTGMPNGYIIPLINGSEYGGKLNYNQGNNDVEIEIVATSLINGFDGDDDTDPVLAKPNGSTVDFGFPAFGQVVTRPITLKNTGTAPLIVSSITVTGESPASPPIQYTILGAPGAAIPINGTHTFQVQLNPLTVGVVSAVVNVASDDPGTPLLSFNVTGTVSTFSYAASMPGFTGPTANIVLDGGKTVTISVPDHTILTPPNDFPQYRLVLNTGVWGGFNTPAITGNGTNTLIIDKALVDNVSIIDSNAAGTNAVTFSGRGVAPVVGRTFDDRFVIVLNGDEDGGPAVAGTVSFTGDCEFTTTNSLEISTLRNIIVSSGVDVSVVDGDLTWNANQGVPTAGSFTGISITGRVVTSGLGDIYMKALGGNGTSERGISLSGSLSEACRVASTGGPGLPGGSITLLGTGGASSSTTSYGVYLANLYVTVESASGDITIEGSSTSTGSSPYGVFIDNAKVRATGSDPVDISITGVGSQVANLGGKYGVVISGANAEISAEKGSISITGTGGSLPDTNTGSDDNAGVLIQASAQILSTGTDPADAATIEITGTGGLEGDDDHAGVSVIGASTKISTDAGDMTLTGTGGGATTVGSINNAGVYFTAGTLESTGAGNIKLSGTAGAGVATASNAGIVLTGTGTDLFTDAGTGSLTLEADQITISATSSHVYITAGSNPVVFQPKTAAFPMVLGGADSVSQLGISQAELNRVVEAGKVVFGSSAAGPVSVLVALTQPVDTGLYPPADLELRSGANIDFVNPGKLTSLGGDVTFLPGTYLLAGTNGVDVDAGVGTVTLGSGSLRAVLDGLTVDSQFRQLNLIGGLTLSGGVGLEFTGSTYSPVVAGDKFILVNNDAADAITGVFAGLPENAVISNFLGSGINARVTYKGEDGLGNDVVLELGDPDVKFLFDADEIANAGTAAFGNVSPGYTKTVTVTIENEGNVSLVLFPSVAVGGSNPLLFTLTPSGGWGSDVTLAPGDSTTFNVAFTPPNVGSYSATLSFNSNDPTDVPFVVDLTGAGVIPPAVPVGGFLDDVVTGGEAPDESGEASIGNFSNTLHRAGFLSLDGSLVFPGELQIGSGAPPVMAANDLGIWKLKAQMPPDKLRLLVREGTPAVDTSFNFLALPTGAPAINRTGQSTFMAELDAPAAENTGLWTEVGDGTLRLVVQEGDDVGGPLISLIGRGTVGTSGAGWAAAQSAPDEGQLAFVSGYLVGTAGVTTSNDTAILRAKLSVTSPTHSVAIEQIAREGFPAPETAPVLNFGSLMGNDTEPQRMDAEGNFAFVAPLSSGSGIFYQPKDGDGPLKKVAQSGETAPGTAGATFSSLQAPSIGTGGYVVFRGLLNANGDNVAGKKNDGIWGGVATGPLSGFTCLLRRGDEVPGPVGSGPTTFMVGNTWGGWVTANGDNRSAFRAWVDVNKDGTASSRGVGDVYGIYANTDGVMRLIAREGTEAPGLPGYTFEYFDHPIVGGLNQTAFIGEARLGATIQRGVWRQSPNGGPLFLLLKLGDSVNTSEGSKVVNGISLPGAESGRAIISGTRRIEQPVMDSTGRLLIWVDFGLSTQSQVILP